MSSLTERLSGIADSSLSKTLAQHAVSPAMLSQFSEEHLHFLAESLPEIVWTAQADGTVDYMNKRWYAYTGLTEEETYGELRTVVHPDDFDLYKEKWAESIRTGKQYEMAYRFRRVSDGMYRWHVGRALPMKDEQGNIVKWFGVCVDIHAQKEAEEQIRRLNEGLELTVAERTKYLRKEIRQRRRAEERYLSHLQLLHSMIDLFPMAAGVVDARNVLLHGNERFYELFHLQKREASPHLPLLTLLTRRFSIDEDVFAKLLAKEKTFRQEVVSDGRTFLLEYIPTLEGALESGYLLLVRDISQEKRIDRAKSEFMSLASHQLRTPLTSMRWALGRLGKILQGKLTMEEADLLHRARYSTITMAETVTTMLAISRIEAGLHKVSASTVNLHKFLEGKMAFAADLLKQKQLNISMSAPLDLAVQTDESMLREIVRNLLTNAIKYTPPGGSVFLEAEQKNSQVVLRVRDTGHGIPTHQQKNVFDKFFRGDNITKFDTEGTGLGLYLVSHLVQAIGATISFTSEEGKGTEFTITMPIR